LCLDRQTDSHGPAVFPFKLARKEPKQCTQVDNVLLLDGMTCGVCSTPLAWQCLHFYTNPA